MNRKGFTLVEMLVTFSVLAVIVVVMTNILFKIIETSEKSTEITKIQTFQANISKMILGDLNTDTLSSLEECGVNCYTLTYDTAGVKELSVSDGVITYGNYVRDIPAGAYIAGDLSLTNDHIESIASGIDSILNIELPIKNNYNDKNYDIAINFQYDSTEVYIENISSLPESPAPAYLYKKKLTIDYTKIDATLTNFPVTVILDSGNFDFSKPKTDGSDIKFLDSGDNLIPFEKELYDSSNQKAVYHVKVPSISSSAATDFWVYYGHSEGTDLSDPENVWDNDFLTVNHMDATLSDSTKNNETYTNSGTTVTDGIVGKNRYFDGTGDYIDVENFYNPATFTISAIVSILGNEAWFLNKRDNASDDQWQIIQYDSGGAIFGNQAYNGTSTVADVDMTGIADTAETYIAMTINGVTSGTTKMFLNLTTATDTLTGNMKLGARDLVIGGPGWDKTSHPFQGTFDELRISGIVRSDAWMKAEYYSLFDTLLTYGPEEGV